MLEQLEKLAQKQDELAEQDKANSAEKQEELQKEFDKFQEELKELQKENSELKHREIINILKKYYLVDWDCSNEKTILIKEKEGLIND